MYSYPDENIQDEHQQAEEDEREHGGEVSTTWEKRGEKEGDEQDPRVKPKHEV